jgi:hypothetical protein
MKRTTRNVGIMFCLCVPFLATGQNPERATAERASQLATEVERTIKDKEKNWSLKKSHSVGPASSQRWRSGARELELRIFVYDSPEEASKMLAHDGVFEVAMSQELDGLGDEARFISHRYFSWVGVRKGAVLAEVQGPGQELDTTKRFAQYAQAQLKGSNLGGLTMH